MRNIDDLSLEFDRFINRLKSNIIIAQNHSTDTMLEDVKDRIEIPSEARNISQFIQYEQSLQKSETQQIGEDFTSSVYSELLVGGDDPKWEFVPVGAFLEWGTGPLGEGTNEYPHGYPYTTEKPWDLHTAMQYGQMGTWGIAARPHLYPALVATKQIHISNIQEAVEEAWKK